MTACTRDSDVQVAVIGTGCLTRAWIGMDPRSLAGLVTAYSLTTGSFTRQDGSEVRANVQLFEKSDQLGMDSSSISVTSPGGTDLRVDSPMRSVNGGSHSLVMKLYNHLKIDLRKSDFSYSFSRLARSDEDSARIRLPAPSPPPPPYSALSDSDSDDVNADVQDPSLLSRPPQSTQFLYEGSSGFVWPPLAFPSHLGRTSLFRKAQYSLHLILLSLSYLYIVALANVYVRCGLNSVRPPKSRTLRRLKALGSRLGVKHVANESLQDWCDRHMVWRAMRDEVLVPLYAAVCTVGRHEAADMPVCGLLDYIVSTFLSSHYVASVGVRQVVQRLAQPISPDNIHLGSPITSITYSTDDVGQLRIMLATDKDTFGPFDHIVFATQANQASRLLSTVSRQTAQTKERSSALNAFTYHRTFVVNHTDCSILPLDERDRRDLNLASFARAKNGLDAKRDLMDHGSDKVVPKTWIQATHILSRTHPKLDSRRCEYKNENDRGPTMVLQTTNPLVQIDPTRVLSETWYERAVLSQTGNQALHRFILPCLSDKADKEDVERCKQGDLQGLDNVWFVGSWCAEGIPLLEGCVSSSRDVVKHLMARHAVVHSRLEFME
ncbi:hypothetical protein OIV83_002960 [Microbotryomycetes sp. JL201]|nr:hypothetical protein OIV83_002960 [Microbotryomycetes sp. JL201]